MGGFYRSANYIFKGYFDLNKLFYNFKYAIIDSGFVNLRIRNNIKVPIDIVFIISDNQKPLFDIKIHTSSEPTIPRSPCNASNGFRKTETNPTEENVAAIFLATIPLFPTPVTSNLFFLFPHFSRISTAFSTINSFLVLLFVGQKARCKGISAL